MSLAWRASAALAAALLSACQSVVRVDPGSPIALDDPRAVERLDAFREQAARRTSLRAAARLSLVAPGLELSRPQRLAVQRPASLRIEVLGLFDQVAGIVVTDGTEFAFVDLASDVRDAGPVHDDLLWRTARVDLTPSDAVALLLGVPRLAARAEVVAVRQFEDGGIGVATRAEHAVRTRWHEWDAAGRLRGAALREPDGSAVWRARFSNWHRVGRYTFAHRVELEFPRVDAKASILFRAVEPNPILSPGVFVLQVPPGG
ncbi:MAG: hypothetical protein VX681_15215 [Myxococcota bacterium]|nr:hypothetical protein [Myxococcota bacterium]